jgi:hypothetical protein
LNLFLKRIDDWKRECATIITNASSNRVDSESIEKVCLEYKQFGILLPEYEALSDIQHCVEEFKKRASELIGKPCSADEIQACFDTLKDYQIFIPEYETLELQQGEMVWKDTFDAFMASSRFKSSQALIDFVQAPLFESISLYNKASELVNYDYFLDFFLGAKRFADPLLISALKKWKEMGDKWRLNAVSLIKQKSIDFEDAVTCMNEAQYVPINPEMYTVLNEIVVNISAWKSNVGKIYENGKIDIERVSELMNKASNLPLSRSSDTLLLQSHINAYNSFVARIRIMIPKTIMKSDIKHTALILDQNSLDCTQTKNGICICRTNGNSSSHTVSLISFLLILGCLLFL